MTPNFNPLDHPDAEVTRAYFCQLTGRSKTPRTDTNAKTLTGPDRSFAASGCSTRRRTASATWNRHTAKTP
jgi:hypothetical protein